MGVHGLSKVLGDCAPASMRDSDIKSFFGRKVAIDASTSLYQFLIAVRSMDGSGGYSNYATTQSASMLTNDAGDVTSHLTGLFYRTIRMLEHGIKPLYVFDGTPPEAKAKELARRGALRAEAEAAAAKAMEDGDAEAANKFARRTVKVTREHTADARRLLAALGVPYLDACGEAEATCAALARAGIVYAAASEDMDTLAYGAPVLLRHLTVSEARRLPVCEVRLDMALRDLEMTLPQFIDMCLLLGCDYCPGVPGVGPKRAVALIRELGSLDAVIEKYASCKELSAKLGDDWSWESFRAAREIFHNPPTETNKNTSSDSANTTTGDSTSTTIDLQKLQVNWNIVPDENALVAFLVGEKNFNEERVRNGVKRILKANAAGAQSRLDSFFKPKPISSNVNPSSKKPTTTAASAAGKRRGASNPAAARRRGGR